MSRNLTGRRGPEVTPSLTSVAQTFYKYSVNACTVAIAVRIRLCRHPSIRQLFLPTSPTRIFFRLSGCLKGAQRLAYALHVPASSMQDNESTITGLAIYTPIPRTKDARACKQLLLEQEPPPGAIKASLVVLTNVSGDRKVTSSRRGIGATPSLNTLWRSKKREPRATRQSTATKHPTIEQLSSRPVQNTTRSPSPPFHRGRETLLQPTKQGLPPSGHLCIVSKQAQQKEASSPAEARTHLGARETPHDLSLEGAQEGRRRAVGHQHLLSRARQRTHGVHAGLGVGGSDGEGRVEGVQVLRRLCVPHLGDGVRTGRGGAQQALHRVGRGSFLYWGRGGVACGLACVTRVATASSARMVLASFVLTTCLRGFTCC